MAFDSSPDGNTPVDVPGVSDATVLLMLADLVEAGHMEPAPPLPIDPVERSRLRLQIMYMFWHHFGKEVWKAYGP